MADREFTRLKLGAHSKSDQMAAAVRDILEASPELLAPLRDTIHATSADDDDVTRLVGMLAAIGCCMVADGMSEAWGDAP